MQYLHTILHYTFIPKQYYGNVQTFFVKISQPGTKQQPQNYRCLIENN